MNLFIDYGVFIIPAVYILVFIILLLIAKKIDKFTKIDMLLPFIPLLVWVGLTAINIGSQSLSNLIEVPIFMIASLVLYIIKMFFPVTWNHKLISNIILIFAIVLVASLRLFFPVIPE